MKKHIFLQNLMILIAVALLLLSFVPGIVTQTVVTADGTVTAEKNSLFTWQASGETNAFPLFIQVVLLCIGTFAFRITEAEKPLGWTIVASALGVAIYALFAFTQNEPQISPLVPLLCGAELVLAAGYKICRHIGLLP